MNPSFRFNGLSGFSEEASPRATHTFEKSLDPGDLLTQIGTEVASALESALERVVALSHTGRIDRTGLKALREEIEQARRIGLMGPQIGRLSSGRVGVNKERVDLSALLREALAQRMREIAARGLEVRQSITPADVLVDPTLLFTLLQALFDWSFEHAASHVDVLVDIRGWPERVHLVCSFSHQPPDVASHDAPEVTASRLETMSWRLLECCASTMGLKLERHDTLGRTLLDLEFGSPLTKDDAADTLLNLDLEARPTSGHNSKPLAGSHVLLVVARRDVRALVRDALRPMGLMLDFVSSVEEARQFCMGGLPHAVVFEAPLGGSRMHRLQAELVAEAPMLAFIEIAEEGQAFEATHAAGQVHARVSRTSLAEALPAALVFELSRVG
jgi:hypothetical protein